MVRQSGRDLNQIQTALAHRSAILDATLTDDTELFKTEQKNLYGEDEKMRWILDTRLVGICAAAQATRTSKALV